MNGMGKHEVIRIAALAREAGIGYEIAHMGRLAADDIEWTGYAIWLHDEVRMMQTRFDRADHAAAWIEDHKKERALYGR